MRPSLTYLGRTWSTTKLSTAVWARPEAVQSAYTSGLMPYGVEKRSSRPTRPSRKSSSARPSCSVRAADEPELELELELAPAPALPKSLPRPPLPLASSAPAAVPSLSSRVEKLVVRVGCVCWRWAARWCAGLGWGGGPRLGRGWRRGSGGRGRQIRRAQHGLGLTCGTSPSWVVATARAALLSSSVVGEPTSGTDVGDRKK